MTMFKINLLNWQNTDQQIHNTHTQWEALLNEVRLLCKPTNTNKPVTVSA